MIGNRVHAVLALFGAVATSAAAQAPENDTESQPSGEGGVVAERFTVRFAPQRSYYFDLRLGAVFLEDAKNTMNDTSIFPAQGKADFESGAAISGAVGYRLDDHFRVDLEIGFNGNEFDDFELRDANVFVFDTFFFGPRVFVDPPDLRAFTYSANLYYDFDPIGRVRPFIGIGGGGATLDIADAPLLDDTDTVPFAQLRAGIAYPLRSWMGLSFAYRFQIAGDPEFTDSIGNRFQSEYRSHGIEFGLRFPF